MVGTTSTTSYTDTGVSPSTTYSYTVAAYDAAGNLSAQGTAMLVTTPAAPDVTPPLASITSPSGGTVAVKSIVSITATASDNVGVTKVQFYVNGSLSCTGTSAPYKCAWKVPASKNQSYKLQVKAYDAAGNLGSSAIVTVTSK